MNLRQSTLFPALPDELVMSILNYLDMDGLMQVAFLSAGGLRFAKAEHDRRWVEHYKSLLSDTTLWRYLAFIAQADEEQIDGRRFTDYLGELMVIPFAQTNSVDRFYRFQQNAMKNAWTQHLPNDFFPGLPQASQLATNIVANYHHPRISEDASTTSQPGTVTEFLNSVATTDSFSDYMKWKSYYDLYQAVLCYALAHQLSWTNDNDEIINILIDPSFSILVDGRILLLLEQYYASGIIMTMLQQAISLYSIPSRQENDTQRLQRLEVTLAKLKEKDLINFLAIFFKNDLLCEKQSAFAEIIQQNYPFLQSKFTEQVLLSVAYIPDKKLLCSGAGEDGLPALAISPLPRAVLSTPMLFNRLSHKSRIGVLNYLPIADMLFVLARPELAGFFTFDTLHEWLDLSGRNISVSYYKREIVSERATKLLGDAGLLASLSRTQIVSLARHVCSTPDVLIGQNAFRKRILQDQNSSAFLMALCQIESLIYDDITDHVFVDEITKYPEFLRLLSVNEIIRISSLGNEAVRFILQDNDVLTRLSDGQLWTLIDSNFIEAVHAVVARNNFLSLLSDSKLHELANRVDDFPEIPKKEKEIINRESSQRYNRSLQEKLLAHEKSAISEDESVKRQPISDLDAVASEETQPKNSNLTKLNQEKLSEERPSVKQIPVEFTKSKPFSTPNAKAHQNSTSTKKMSRKKQNRLIWQIIFYTLLTLIGLALIASGIGGIAGVPLFAKMSALLVSMTPVHLAISSLVLGVVLAATSIFQVIGRAIQYHALEKNNSPKPSYQSLSRLLPLQPLAQTAKQNDTRKDNTYQFSKQSSLRSFIALKEQPSSKDSTRSPDEMQSISSGVTLTRHSSW